jgi:hypothetical protein
MSIEKPSYSVIEKEGSIEIRAYQPYITAEVVMPGQDFNEAASRGFSPLANFIFGGNTASNKISMTAPVTAQPANEKIAMTSPVTVTSRDAKGNSEYRVAFMMPSKYSLDTLPQPLDSRVQFHSQPARKMAAIRFSGTFQQSNFDHHLNHLRAWLKSRGFREAGLPVMAGYDPPFTPWFLKHNEILIEIES